MVTCGYLHQLYHKPLVTCDNNVFGALNLFRSLLFPYESCVWILWFWNLRWMQRLYITPCNYLSCSCVKFIDLIFPVLRGAYNSSDRYTFNINVCSWFYMFLYAYNRQINSIFGTMSFSFDDFFYPVWHAGYCFVNIFLRHGPNITSSSSFHISIGAQKLVVALVMAYEKPSLIWNVN